MKKALKVIGKVLLGILAAIVVFLAAMTVYHNVMLKKEAPLREPVGQLVKVDGNNMCIYTMNRTMRNEADRKDTINFCDAIENDPQPDIPILLFVSDGTGGTGHDKEVWRGYVREYAANLPDAEIVELDCGHYVHNIEQDAIAEKMRDFIGELDG